MKTLISLFLLFLPQFLLSQHVVVLSVNQPPELGFSVSKQDTTIIAGSTVSLRTGLEVFGGSGMYSYKWSPGSSLSDSLSLKTEASPGSTTLYTLTVTDGNGCSFTLPYQLNVVPPDQSIRLRVGWNIISYNFIPWSADMKIVAQSLIKEGSMIKVQDESGNSMEDYGLFGGWVNNIGEINLTEGYKVKVSRDCHLNIIGQQPPLPFKIPLKTGWNIIGYPHRDSINGLSIVQQLIDRKKLIKVQDENGNSLEDYGLFGGWTNNIGKFKPGRGYKIKVSVSDTLTVYESYPKSSVSPMSQLSSGKPLHFIPATLGNGVDHMNINLVDIPTGLLEEGDEIGVFDGVVCLGALKFTVHSSQFTVKSEITNHQSPITNQTIPIPIQDPQSAIRNLSVPVSASDGPDCPGFTEGHLIVLKVWKAAEMKEYDAKPEIISGTSTFLKHESTFVSLAKNTMTSVQESELPAGMELTIYPNPTDGKVYIQYSGKPLAGMQISVINMPGQEIQCLTTTENPAVIDLSRRVIGIYTIRVTGDGWSKTEKIILK